MFYRNDIKNLDKLLGIIDLNFDFKSLLKYYYICEYSQVVNQINKKMFILY